MLARLIRATGHRLVLELERSSEYSPGLPDTPLGRRLRQRRHSILACAARHGASNVRVFGSTARGEDQAEGDVDVIVDLEKGTGLFALQRVSYLDPPVRLDQLNHMAQRCLFTVRLPRRCFV